jgi:hypothetical protein
VVQCTTHVIERLDLSHLDPDDPFEIDSDNRPHLYKHLPNWEGRWISIGEEDLLDVYLFGQPAFYPADMSKGEAHWLLTGEIPGLVIVVPLAQPRSGDPRKCRPIGIYAATESERKRYLADRR